jgi:hypothetical protein
MNRSRLPFGLERLGLGPATLVLAASLTLWLWWFPPSPDLAAQVYRLHLFSVEGFAAWDENWYAGHYLPGYSLIAPALTALLGLRWAGVLAVCTSTFCFGALARLHFGARASRSTALFALSAAGDLYIGRVTFAIGVSFGMAAVLAVTRGRNGLGALLSLGCAAASPVAALFVALAAAADLLTYRRPWRALALGAPGLVLIGLVALLFPEGGEESFGFLSLLAAAGLSGALLILLPPRERLLRNGTMLYLAALALSYVLSTPVGSNAVRLGVLLVPAILAGAVGVKDVNRALQRAHRAKPTRQAGGRPVASRGHPRLSRVLLALLGLGAVLWQIDGPVVQSVQASADPSTRLSYYMPVIRFLDRHGGSAPIRIEVPFTASHWDAVMLGQRFALARGWERQLDMRYDPLFYEPRLRVGAYHAWLLSNAVRYVLLSDASLDYSSRQEASLIRRGLPFLRQVFGDAHWHVYAVIGARPLVSGPGRAIAVSGDGFTLHSDRPGSLVVRVHYTPYWHVSAGGASVREAPGGWTEVWSDGPGQIVVKAELPFGL